MNDILWRFADLTPRRFAPGEVLIEEGLETGKLFVLKSGTVEVRRGGVAVTSIAEPGAVLGEMSALLDRPHTASVVATAPVEAYGLDNGVRFLADRPALALHVAQLLAQRLDTTTALLDRLKASAADKKRDTSLFDRLLGFLTGREAAG
ncbi:MAG TPA: cyclic nucleotide-binding domain-containing protein [Devosia sp.]|nr:cyclic nucleotide-binding domain-containing protein [Devosia sp.]